MRLNPVTMTAVAALAVGMTNAAHAAEPTIDGVRDTDEWAAATPVDIDDLEGEVRLLVIPPYLFVLFDHEDSTDARAGENTFGNDQTSVNINPGTGSFGFPYDIIFQTGADSSAWGGTNSGSIDGWETDWEIDVGGTTTQQDLPTDVEVATSYTTGGDKIMEWKIPLDSIDSLSPVLLIGGAIDIGDQASHLYPVGLDFNEPDTFLELPVPPSFACVGLEEGKFEPPLDTDVSVKKPNRVLPLRMMLLDEMDLEITDADLAAAPVVEVDFLGASASGGEVPTELESAGRGDDGNTFQFDGSNWAFNLRTRGFDASGTYKVTAVSGDQSEYVINPTCEVNFVIE